MPTYPKCRRGHPQSPANMKYQTNRWRTSTGVPKKRQAKVCRVCARQRNARTAAGLKNKDMRRGKR